MWRPVGVKPAAPPLSSCCCRPVLSARLQYFMSAPKTGFLPGRSSGGPSSQAGKQLQHLSLVEGRGTETCRLSCSRLFVPASAPIHEINTRLKAALKQHGPRSEMAHSGVLIEMLNWSGHPVIYSSMAMAFPRHQRQKKTHIKLGQTIIKVLAVHIPERLDSSWVEVDLTSSLHRVWS